MVSPLWPSWLQELKRENNFLNDTGRISDFQRNVSLIAIYQNCSNDSTLLNKMAARVVKPLKLHLLLGKLLNSKIISQKCSSYIPLQNVLKWLRCAEQTGHQSQTLHNALPLQGNKTCREDGCVWSVRWSLPKYLCIVISKQYVLYDFIVSTGTDENCRRSCIWKQVRMLRY